MNNLCKRLICGLTAFSFAFATFFIPVSADGFGGPLYPYIRDFAFGEDSLTDYYDRLSRYIDEYRTQNPDSTYLEAYRAFKNSDANGHHGGGGAGGHRDSDLFDKMFHSYEISENSDTFQGTQTDYEYLSYDSRVRIECRKDFPKPTQIHYAFYIYVDGVNPIRNDGLFFEDTCYYDNSGSHGSGCYWKVKGTVLYSNTHMYAWRPNASGGNTYSYGTNLHTYDFKSFITFSSDNTNNYYTVYDNSGQQWHYDPISNSYYDNSDHFEPYIDLDISQFPAQDFEDFYNQLKQLYNDSAFQFFSLYDLINQILSTLNGFEFGTTDDKGDTVINLTDYTALLNQIQAALVVISNNMTTLSTHADCVELINILNNFYQNQKTDTAHIQHICDQMKDILSRLDVIIELQDIMITEDVLDDLTENDVTAITTYLSLVLELLSKYPLSLVQSSIDTMHSLIFNRNAPSDIKFNYKGSEYTILSSSTLTPFISAIEIARMFISVVILYTWLIYMRKKIVDTI